MISIKYISKKSKLRLLTINKLLYLLIMIIEINQSFSKSIQISTNMEQKITITSLQGECTLIPCGDSFCSMLGGICEETPNGKICKCKDDFTTPEEDEFYNCCYQQKSSIKAFFLEACLFFGFGHFYVGNKKLGIIKAIVYAILLILTAIIILRR